MVMRFEISLSANSKSAVVIRNVFGTIPFNYIAESGPGNWVQRGLNEGDFITAYSVLHFYAQAKSNVSNHHKVKVVRVIGPRRAPAMAPTEQR
jgi:hypothetical protein